jgi:hypothetical protein
MLKVTAAAISISTDTKRVVQNEIIEATKSAKEVR